MVYIVVFFVLLACELLYFKIADKCNIIDKPNQRSSHTKIVLRGGGIIFLIGVWVWAIASLLLGSNGFQMVSDALLVPGCSGCQVSRCYPFFLLGLTLVAGISFIDDIHSLPDSVRLIAQFTAMVLMFLQLGLFDGFHVSCSMFQGIILPLLIVIAALIVCVGATNIYNFMDGINGITGGYSLAILIPLLLMNSRSEFIESSFLVVVILSVLVFCIFNFRPKNHAKCFAGDVGSVGIAFILLFCIGKLVLATADVTWLLFLIVYGVDGCLTIVHRILLHENLGEAHRKHAYQIMANELGLSHVTVSLLYMALQLVISLVFIYLIPDTALSHWLHLLGVIVLLSLAYLLFMKRYYHLHEEYLASIKK